ncbi:MAG: hypothetical protein BAJALOKI1v1_420019 [Promethearchaeota archaeon]|nr:MAG: hypothetical protein BAJALOKI1v1_420019 [Candidatus Lokiarchaeota archaeon]
MSDKNIWKVKIDWLKILNSLGLTSIDQIPEYKRERAIKNISKMFEPEDLIEFDPEELEELMVGELGELMKKELREKQRREDEMREQFNNKIIPLKRGGIIKIDPRDLKDLDLDGNPEDILKYFYKKFFGGSRNSDEKDDDDRVEEDKTGYYI